MSFARILIFLLVAATPALAIGPQLEPEPTLTCAAVVTTDTPCRASRLPGSDRALLHQATGGTVVPYRQPLWTVNSREYKLVGRAPTLYVTLTRGGDGPWQVTRAARQPEPRAFVPAGELRGNTPVTVRASGLPPRVRVVARLGVPNAGAGRPVSGGTVGADGTVTLSFVMPAVWHQPQMRVKTASGASITVPAQDRLITESGLVLLVGTLDGRVKAVTSPLPYWANVSERDLSATHEGQLRFRYLRGETVRESPGRVEVLELGAMDAVTVMQAQKYARAGNGPGNDAAYVRSLLTLHPDALRPFTDGTPEVEGTVDTPSGRAWRLLVKGEDGMRPVYVLLRGDAVWVVQGNPAHAPLLDAMVQTLSAG
ncbi:hypothetical protein [Deinococcus apachensis]|uniref:hypothetical protein n=1 Tax=Deinococcus apachensis TaxID=309886 RepID=UPI00037AA559|nr:hypothetical protein [Deinococcus apachensis]